MTRISADAIHDFIDAPADTGKTLALRLWRDRIGEMAKAANEIDSAIAAFVRGFSAGKSATHPYEFFRVGRIWVR